MSPRYLVAPDKFKGSLTAREVADAIADGLHRADPGSSTTTLPLADGGDGSVDAAIASGYQPHAITCRGALGATNHATIALKERSAVVEVASTCGLAALGDERDALRASSFGLGEAILAAATAGAREIVVGLGGSASTDAGCGMLAALGARFLDVAGRPFIPTGGTLSDIAAVDTTDIVWLSRVRLIGASDVDTPLIGPAGAAPTFAPQKGATPHDVDHLARGLERAASILSTALQTISPDTPRTGSAGGIGYAIAALGGHLVSGAEHFLGLVDFHDAARQADIIITGEGRIDDQTPHGKLVAAVCLAAPPADVLVVAGQSTLNPANAESMGIRAIVTVADQTDEDTSRNPELTRAILTQIGFGIADREALTPRNEQTSVAQ